MKKIMKITNFLNSLDDTELYLKNAKSFHQICQDANVTFNKRNKQIILEYLKKYNINLQIIQHRKEFPKKYCLYCSKPIDPKSKNKFCNHSCAATYNNGLRNPRYCIYCGKKLNAHQSKYCCKDHQRIHEYNEWINKWLNGMPSDNSTRVSSTIRRYLFELHNSKCEKCGWGEINKATGLIPLQIHHIDGDCHNNKFENLQLLCPNCHSLTETFGSLNKNSTRHYQIRKYRKVKNS